MNSHTQIGRTVATHLALPIFAFAGAAHAQTTWQVGSDPGDLAEITDVFLQPAFASGDTIRVDPGQYQAFDLFFYQDIQVIANGDSVEVIGTPNTSCVRVNQGQSATTRFEGITFSGGGGSLTPSGLRQGGGAWVLNASPTFVDCVFIFNQADIGGGVYVRGDDGSGVGARFEDCRFDTNLAEVRGGGLSVEDTSVHIERSTFQVNLSPGSGAGISFGSGASSLPAEMTQASQLVDCAVIFNGLNDPQPEFGGGIAVLSYPFVDLVRCSVGANEAGSGAGIYVELGGLNLESSSILANTASDQGGGLRIGKGINCRFNNSEVFANMSEGDGAGLYLTDDSVGLGAPLPLTMDNCVVASNTILSSGLAQGGAMYLSGASASINRTTISDNTGPNGNGIVFEAGTSLPLTLDSCILWGNQADGTSGSDSDQLQWGSVADADNLIVRFTDWEGSSSSSVEHTGADNIDCDPGFVAGSQLPDVVTVANDYYLDPFSGCGVLDGGNPALLLDGVESTDVTLAPDTGLPDMGYHYNAAPAAAPPVALLSISSFESDQASQVIFTLDSRFDLSVRNANQGSPDTVFALITGTTAGTNPGTPFGGIVVPINFDVIYTQALLDSPQLFFSTPTLQLNQGLVQWVFDVSGLPPAAYSFLESSDVDHATFGLRLDTAGANIVAQTPSDPVRLDLQ